VAAPVRNNQPAGKSLANPDPRHGLLQLQKSAGNSAVSSLLTRDSAVTVSRDAGKGGDSGTAPPEASTTYLVGGVNYQGANFAVAVGQIANLWTSGIGMVSKRKEAVAEFCGSGGAGAKADEGSLADAMLSAALTGLLAIATDGVGLVVEAALSRAVVGIARRVSLDPAIVLGAGDKVIKVVIDKGKDEAKKAIPAAVSAATTHGPSSGTQLATPLATYQSALDAALDADAAGSTQSTLDTLMNLPNDPTRWAVAAALYEAISQSGARAKELQWNATSDGWFSMQTTGGAGTLAGVDSGIVSIMLADDAYPSSALRASGAYLGGPDANAATVRTYDDRPLGEIQILKRIIMDNGSLGRGLVPCGWEIDLDSGGLILNVPAHSRWGWPWLAAKKVGARDLATNSPQVSPENVYAGAQLVWDEIKTKSASQLGARFAVTGVWSGTDAY
jgi:hypothetical protein